MTDFDRALAAESFRFRRALAQVPADALVPACPGWTSADLLEHLTGVQRFWAGVVAGRAADREAAEATRTAASEPARPLGLAHDLAHALAQFDEASAHLRDALAQAADDVMVWTWSRDHTVGWVRRRQAHEALIHRVDAEQSAGQVGPVPADLAADGVDEVLAKFDAGSPDWGSFAPFGRLVEVACAGSDRTWRVRLGRFRGTAPDGSEVDEPDFEPVALHEGAPDATVQGPAADLLLWLWGRGGPERLHAQPDVLAELRAALAANMQ